MSGRQEKRNRPISIAARREQRAFEHAAILTRAKRTDVRAERRASRRVVFALIGLTGVACALASAVGALW